jgi:hypothetical protein
MDKYEELKIYNITIGEKTYYLYPVNTLPASLVISMMVNPSPDNFYELLFKAAFVEDTKKLLQRISFGDLMELSEAYMAEWYKDQEKKEEAKSKEKKRWFKRLD